jgi:hypothetical protein
MRYLVHITLLRGEVRFFAKGHTREDAKLEALEYIRTWPLDAKNQPCSYRIEESHWLFAEKGAHDG